MEKIIKFDRRSITSAQNGRLGGRPRKKAISTYETQKGKIIEHDRIIKFQFVIEKIRKPE